MGDALLFADRTSIDMQSVLSRQKDLFDRDYRRPALRIRKHFIEEIPQASSGRRAVELIERYLGEVERALAAIVADHSSYCWLYMLRRIMPVSTDGHDDWSISLARTIAELAVLKHASSIGPDLVGEFQVEESQYYLRDAGYFDYIAAYQIEYLAFEFWHLTAVARSVWKGASLIVDGRQFGCDMSDDLTFLIDSIDARIPAQPLLTQIADLEDLASRGDSGARDRAQILLFTPNSGKHPFNLMGEGEPFVPNYLPYVADVSGVEDAFRPYDQALALAGMLGSGALGIFLEAIWLRASHIWFTGFDSRELRLKCQYQFLQRAYWLSRLEPDELAANIAEAYVMVHGGSEVTEVARLVGDGLLQFTYSTAVLPDIDLWDRAPMRFIWRLDDGQTLIDFAKIPAALNDIASRLGSASGDTGTIKGYRLEENLEGIIRSLDQVAPWVCRGVVKDCTGTQKEIDVSFVAGDTLVIVECKALVRSRLIDRGEIVTLRRRWDELRGYLADAGAKAELIQACPEGRNYSLPPEVRWIVWVVCTSDAEYIHSRDSRFWLDSTIPRICTAGEIVSLIKAGHNWRATPETLEVRERPALAAKV